jgi:YggT family protein
VIAGVLVETVQTLVTVFSAMIVIRSLLSWFRPATYSRLYRDVVGTLDMLTEPLIGPIRNVLPATGGVDWSPLVALILLQIVGNLLVRILVSL